MSEIAKAKERLNNLRLGFNARKEAEWQEVSALARLNLYQAIWNARDAGVTVAEIGRQYGTKDRKTIYEILNKRAELSTIEPQTTTVRPLSAEENPDEIPNAFMAVTPKASVGFYIHPSGMALVIDTLFDEGNPDAEAVRDRLLAWDVNDPLVQMVIKEVGL